MSIVMTKMRGQVRIRSQFSSHWMTSFPITSLMILFTIAFATFHRLDGARFRQPWSPTSYGPGNEDHTEAEYLDNDVNGVMSPWIRVGK